MKPIWHTPASRDIVAIAEFIALDSEEAANRVIDAIEDQIDLLLHFPNIGRNGRMGGTRERPVSDTPYIIVYRFIKPELHILRILHGAQLYPTG